VARGPSIGGIRMAPDVSAAEAFRLARAMTMKNSAANLPHGGGKSVIFGDPKMDLAKKEQLIRAFARAIRDLVEYIPDRTWAPTSAAWPGSKMRSAAPSVCRRKSAAFRSTKSAPPVGASRASVEAAMHIATSISKAPAVAIQGFGSVGKHAARFLGDKGTILVAASDSRGTIFNPQGIDVARLIALKDSGKGVTDYPDGQRLDVDA
jgi:glutamate dehydrogenase (NAD(P)+)